MLGINTAYRAGELLSVTYSHQVLGAALGDTLEIKQSKTARYRRVTLNRPPAQARDHFLKFQHCSPT